MKPKIEKIRISELESFVRSKTFAKMEWLPISPSRAISYTKNPNARPDDVALYLCFIDNKMVAFRSVFAGLVNGDEKIRFGWCSGNWVHPDFRRKGFSQLLLKEVYQDWNRKLMFTNYAPASEKLYLKTGWFYVIHRFQGARAYIFPKTVKLLSVAKKYALSKMAFRVVDFFLSVTAQTKSLFFNPQLNPDIDFKLLSAPDDECYIFIEQKKEQYLFLPGEEQYKWIFEWPWISDSNQIVAAKYPFSSWNPSCFYQTVKVFRKNKLEGLCIFSVRSGHLKTLYVHLPEYLQHDFSVFLKKYSINHKIEMATIYHSGLADRLIKGKFPFLRVKRYGQKIYSSFEIKNLGNYYFQDGDGDSIFT